MRKKFSWADVFEKRHEAPRQIEPVPLASEVPPARKHRPANHTAPYLIAAGIVISVAVSVALLAFGGKPEAHVPFEQMPDADAFDRSQFEEEAEPPAVKPEVPSEGWVEHKIVEVPPPPVKVTPPPPPKKPDPPKRVARVARDPESDLFNFGAEPVAPPRVLSDDVRKADELMERGRLLLQKWYGERKKATIVEANRVLEQAVEAYRKAAAAAPGDAYVKAQLQTANSFHNTAIKYSPF